jgi:hypothetical protein
MATAQSRQGGSIIKLLQRVTLYTKINLATNGGKHLRIKQSKKDKILFLHTPKTQPAYGIIVNLDPEPKKYAFPFGKSQYLKILDSADANWGDQTQYYQTPLFGATNILHNPSI